MVTKESHFRGSPHPYLPTIPPKATGKGKASAINTSAPPILWKLPLGSCSLLRSSYQWGTMALPVKQTDALFLPRLLLIYTPTPSNVSRTISNRTLLQKVVKDALPSTNQPSLTSTPLTLDTSGPLPPHQMPPPQPTEPRFASNPYLGLFFQYSSLLAEHKCSFIT